MVQAYVDALCRQIAMHAPLVGHMDILSLYIGGGTPTTLDSVPIQTGVRGLAAALSALGGGCRDLGGRFTGLDDPRAARVLSSSWA